MAPSLLRIYPSSTRQRVADFAFSSVTEGFVIVIATIDVSVKCAGKSYVLLRVLLVCGAPLCTWPLRCWL